MKDRPRLPSLPDLVRAHAPTEQETVQRLLDYFARPAASFSYQPSRTVAAPAFAHSVVRPQIQAAMMKSGSPSGRKQNREVADLLWDAGEGRSVSCYPMRDGQFMIRRDLSIRVPADFLFVEDRTPNVFWFQPRRTFALTQLGLGVIGSILRMTFLVDDLSSAGIEIVDLSAPNGARNTVSYRLKDLPIISDAEVNRVMQQVAAAYDTICAMDRDWAAEAKAKRHSRPPPPSQAGLFG